MPQITQIFTNDQLGQFQTKVGDTVLGIDGTSLTVTAVEIRPVQPHPDTGEASSVVVVTCS